MKAYAIAIQHVKSIRTKYNVSRDDYDQLAYVQQQLQNSVELIEHLKRIVSTSNKSEAIDQFDVLLSHLYATN